MLTSYQYKCCHVALTAIEIRTHLQEAVELLATYDGHVTLVPVSFPNYKKDKNKIQRQLYDQGRVTMSVLSRNTFKFTRAK